MEKLPRRGGDRYRLVLVPHHLEIAPRPSCSRQQNLGYDSFCMGFGVVACQESHMHPDGGKILVRRFNTRSLIDQIPPDAIAASR